MTDDEKELGELLAPIVREGRPPDPLDHPAPEKLAAYQANELSPAEDDLMREHIAVCRECANLVLGLQAILDAASEEPSGVVDLQQRAAWKKLTGAPALAAAAGPRRRRSALFRWVLPFAAALAAVVVGFLAFEPFGPRGEVTLDPVGAFRGGEVEERVAAPRSFDLVLRVAGRSYPEYRVEIRQGEEVVKTLSGLREDEPLNVLLEKPGSSLEPGEYEIVLFGVLDGHPEEADTYQVRLVDR